MTTPTPDPLADPVTLAAYEALSNAPTRAGFIMCPECDDFVGDSHAPKLDHAQTCQPLRSVAVTP